MSSARELSQFVRDMLDFILFAVRWHGSCAQPLKGEQALI